jgi:hypothetical protein
MRTSNVERPTSNVKVNARRSFFTSSLDVARWTFDVRIFLSVILAITTITKAAPTTQATTTAVTQPTAANLELHEWAVFVVDGSSSQLNPQGLVSATVPPFVTDHRFGSTTPPDAPAAPANGNQLFFNGRFWQRGTPPVAHSPVPVTTDLDDPSPVGIIRLVGSADSKVDVSITARGGSFLGSWPKAEDRANQLLWRDLTVSQQPDDQPPVVDPQHWFTNLRSVPSAYLSLTHGGTDRFLLYDLEAPYACPVKAQAVKEKAAKDFTYELSNPTPARLHDLTLYQGDRDGWRTVSIGDLAPTAPPVNPPSKKPTDPSGKNALGVKLIDVSADLTRAKNWGYDGTTGLIVDTVWPNTPAHGKLRAGDIIMEVDGRVVPKADDFLSMVASASGSTLKLQIFRHNKSKQIELPLPGQPAATQAIATTGPTTKNATTTTSAPTTLRATTNPSLANVAALPRTVHLTVSPSTQPSDLADAWKPAMVTAGVDPADTALITRVIARYAFDPHRLTAIYRMDDAEFDRLLPLEVVPEPAKIKRFALVIVVNVDPAAGTVVDDLIKQLGDDDWSRRDAAYKALAAMGPAATAKLTVAKTDKDLEIAWRAEKLLAALPQAGK